MASDSPTSQTNEENENEASKEMMDLTADHPSEEPSSSNQNKRETIIHEAATNEHHETDGREIILGALDDQPISSIPSLSVIGGTDAMPYRKL